MDPTRLLNPALNHDFANDRAKALAVILPVVEAQRGNLTAIARELRLGIDTVRRWIRKEPKLRKAVERARITAIKEAP